ncbi:hypothetical protein [Pseudidiomarina gelatinasegens]|uniref:hypothetical protein n=1 Tax=Pseudidiomarina gelatinasegens TaxID=2487740 RepID=UPI003A975C49
MNTLLKLMIIVSLLLAPFSGPAQAAALSSASMMSHHAMMDTATSDSQQHDCCEQPAVEATNMHQSCDNSCSDCQHHCSSSAGALVARFAVDALYHPVTLWPSVNALLLTRSETSLRPPMSA